MAMVTGPDGASDMITCVTGGANFLMIHLFGPTMGTGVSGGISRWGDPIEVMTSRPGKLDEFDSEITVTALAMMVGSYA